MTVPRGRYARPMLLLLIASRVGPRGARIDGLPGLPFWGGPARTETGSRQRARPSPARPVGPSSLMRVWSVSCRLTTAPARVPPSGPRFPPAGQPGRADGSRTSAQACWAIDPRLAFTTAPGSAPGAQLSSEDAMRTGRPGAGPPVRQTKRLTPSTRLPGQSRIFIWRFVWRISAQGWRKM